MLQMLLGSCGECFNNHIKTQLGYLVAWKVTEQTSPDPAFSPLWLGREDDLSGFLICQQKAKAQSYVQEMELALMNVQGFCKGKKWRVGVLV